MEKTQKHFSQNIFLKIGPKVDRNDPMPSFIVNHTKNHKKVQKIKKDFIINNQAIKMKHVWNQELADVTTYFFEQ